MAFWLSNLVNQSSEALTINMTAKVWRIFWNSFYMLLRVGKSKVC